MNVVREVAVCGRLAVRSINAMQSLGVVEDRDSREPMSLALYTLYSKMAAILAMVFFCLLAN